MPSDRDGAGRRSEPGGALGAGEAISNPWEELNAERGKRSWNFIILGCNPERSEEREGGVGAVESVGGPESGGQGARRCEESDRDGSGRVPQFVCASGGALPCEGGHTTGERS